MPPRKNVDKISESEKPNPPKEKVPSKRKVKEKVVKPKLKIPSVIKLKIPLQKSFVCPPEAPQEVKKKNKGNDCPNALTRKIELANEVALAQLTKHGVKEIKEQIKQEETNQIETLKKRPPKKNTTSVANGVKDEKKGKVVIKRKKPIKDPNAPPTKRVRNNKSPKENGTLKTEADSTSTKQVSRRRSNRIKAKPLTESPEKQITSPKGKTKDVSASEASASILKGASNILINGNQDLSVFKSKDPKPVDSRKTSTSECLSWTKDISSSSTTSCLTVGSNVFVRFDNKIPLIEIPNIDEEVMRRRRMNDSESDKSSSSSSRSTSTSSSSSARSLPLSTSSLETHKQSNNKNDEDDLTYALQKLTAKLERIDLEAISWIGYENQTIDTKVDAIQDKTINLLTEENEVIDYCKQIKELLGVDDASAPTENKNVVAQDVNNFIDKSEEDENFTSPKGRNVMLNQSCLNTEEPLQTPKEYDTFYDDYTSDKVKYTSFEQDFNDDDCDDALSLFAESITGFESSRINSSANSICANASDFEEYVPQPMAARERVEAPSYVPTRIKDQIAALQNKSKTVCEKQNADSTSIYKETENCETTKLQPEENEANQSNQNVISQTVIRPTYKMPLPPSEFKKQTNASANPGLNGFKSAVYKGVCFYNLMSSCKKIHCQYPHHILSTTEVCNRLLDLKSDMFVQEYSLINSWPDLRRRYGLCYINECIRRKLTRLLVEMSINFIAKGRTDSVEDAALRIHSIERTLLYLNNIDLHTCEDLLRTQIKDVYLCDIYMDTIAHTQNFSRFKVVFVKLVDLMVGLGRTFKMDVAAQILERVCILRCEKPIFEAMVKILEKTDEKILENPMMQEFEKHLSVLAPELYSKFFGMKGVKLSGEGRAEDVPMDERMLPAEREQRYTSPDTTKIDMNKSIEDPMPQKVKIIRPSIYSQLFKLNANLTSENRDKHQFRSYRGKYRGHMQGPYVPRGAMRPPMRPPMIKRRVQQHRIPFGLSPSKFPRRPQPGPDYY